MSTAKAGPNDAYDWAMATCPQHQPQPGDDEAGRALLRTFGDMVAARCAEPKTLLRGVGAT